MGAVIAFMLAPTVARLERVGVRRGYATAIVYLSLLLVLIVAAGWIGGGLATQLSQLSQQVPVYASQIQKEGIPAIEQWLVARGVTADFSRLQGDAASALQSISSVLLGRGISIITGITDALVNIVLVLVISLYLLLDARRIRDSLASLVPARRQRLFAFLEKSLVDVLGGYIRGQLAMAAIIGASSGIGCWLLGVRYPLVIGVLAFLFELIPMLGPVLAAIPAIVISLFQPFPLVLFVIAFFVVMQLVESNVLGPRITGHAVGMHPVVSILALLGGAEIAGLWGALFAVPVVGLVAVVGAAALKELRGPAVVAAGQVATSFETKPNPTPTGEAPRQPAGARE
jgi:predicted PurR-regulated permease PerM